MASGKNKKRLLLSIIAVAAMSSGVARSDTPEPLQCLGRWVGAGWGDGYHACETSGFRPAANLPPRSYYQKFDSGRCGAGSPCAAISQGANSIARMYGNVSQGCESDCVSGNCDAAPCDAMLQNIPSGNGSECDSFGCNIAPIFEALNSPDSYSYSSDPIAQPEPEVTGDGDGVRDSIEELPVPKAASPETIAPETHEKPPMSPSDAPSVLESAAATPSSNALALDLHESQMRPIRPLPPQPKRELVSPEVTSPRRPAPESYVPNETPVGRSNAEPYFFAPNAAGETNDSLFLNQAGIRINPFVVPPRVAKSASPRLKPLSSNRSIQPDDEPQHRIAEVPTRIFVTQPK